MYRVRTYEEALASVGALPVDALAGYVGVIDVLELTPWNGVPISDANSDGAVRQMVFGPGGNGLVTYLILEDQQRVDVLGLVFKLSNFYFGLSSSRSVWLMNHNCVTLEALRVSPPLFTGRGR